MRLLQVDLEVERRVGQRAAQEGRDLRRHRGAEAALVDAVEPQALRVRRDVLQPEEVSRVAPRAEHRRAVALVRVEVPGEGAVGQPEHAVAVRVAPGRDGGPAGAAPRRRAEHLGAARALRRQCVQVRRMDGADAVAAEVPPQVVAGDQHDVRPGR